MNFLKHLFVKWFGKGVYFQMDLRHKDIMYFCDSFDAGHKGVIINFNVNGELKLSVYAVALDYDKTKAFTFSKLVSSDEVYPS